MYLSYFDGEAGPAIQACCVDRYVYLATMNESQKPYIDETNHALSLSCGLIHKCLFIANTILGYESLLYWCFTLQTNTISHHQSLLYWSVH